LYTRNPSRTLWLTGSLLGRQPAGNIGQQQAAITLCQSCSYLLPRFRASLPLARTNLYPAWRTDGHECERLAYGHSMPVEQPRTEHAISSTMPCILDHKATQAVWLVIV